MHRLITIALIMLGLIATASPAMAQDLSLRLEPGIAMPVNAPQDNRFLPGLSLGAKLDLHACPWFSFGPGFQELVLPSNVSGVAAGTAAEVVGFARVMRPHNNKGRDFGAISPWIEGSMGYARTGSLDRFVSGVQVGAALPMDLERRYWLGAFLAYQDVFQPSETGLWNTSDAKIFTVGLSLEIGPKMRKHHRTVVCPVCEGNSSVVMVAKEMASVETHHEYVETIQFAWDSFKLDNTATKQLSDVVAQIKGATAYDDIKVEGYASSEGQLERNDTLATNRAKAVRTFLVASGLPQDKVSAEGFGITNPVGSNKTVSGRVHNRRASFVVKFTVSKKGGSK